MVINAHVAQQAADYLAKADPVLAPVIKTHGLCTMRPHNNYYQELVESIIGQQLSVKAGASIMKKFVALFGDSFPEPSAILAKDADELRTAGLSRAKATYVRDLAQRVVDGKVKFDHLDTLTNEQVIQELVAVKGIGEWTVHMFLMFCMGRTDVLATGDLGIKNGIWKLYGFHHQPSPQEVKEIAEKHNWHPYESIACWYIWQSLDNAP
ncbi:MAG: DNA-3-methyladenine glycosylase family protein [Candidatus Saccharimonadales bacterium]